MLHSFLKLTANFKTGHGGQIRPILFQQQKPQPCDCRVVIRRSCSRRLALLPPFPTARAKQMSQAALGYEILPVCDLHATAVSFNSAYDVWYKGADSEYLQ